MFTFIIPCFNNNTFLRATLTSILWQVDQGHQLEVILVDNNSKRENPDDVYQEFFGKLDIFLVKQPKLQHTFALCRARNVALCLAKHPWVISLDADIVINQNYLHNLKKIINRHPDVIIASERIFIDGSEAHKISEEGISWPENQKILASPSNYYQETDRRMPAMKNMDASSHPWAFMHGCNVVFSLAKAQAIKGYDESYDGHWGYEDVDFAYRLITENAVRPIYGEGMYCYHLEIPQLTHDSERFEKNVNPNWQRICEKIPGFREYKEVEYRQLSKLIKT